MQAARVGLCQWVVSVLAGDGVAEHEQVTDSAVSADSSLFVSHHRPCDAMCSILVLDSRELWAVSADIAKWDRQRVVANKFLGWCRGPWC